MAEAVVVGAQDEDGLVRLTLFLVAPGEDPDALYQKVQDKLLGTLSKYKCPRRIVFMEAIPRTATGKARRFQLRNWISKNLMPRLLRHIGLDPAMVEKEAPQLFRHMQSKCAMCDSHDNCAAALDEDADFEVFPSSARTRASSSRSAADCRIRPGDRRRPVERSLIHSQTGRRENQGLAAAPLFAPRVCS